MRGWPDNQANTNETHATTGEKNLKGYFASSCVPLQTDEHHLNHRQPVFFRILVHALLY